jgi:hypothetical protein
MMDEVDPIVMSKPAAAAPKPAPPKPQKGWTVVAAQKKRKPCAPANLEIIQVSLKELRGADKDIFNELRKVFPNGLTATQIALKLNQQDQDAAANFSVELVGNFLYGDVDSVPAKLCDYVIPIDPKQRPRVWRIRALTDN